MINDEHIAKPGLNITSLPAIRLKRNGRVIEGGEQVVLAVTSHPDNDKLTIIRTENNDEYVVRTAVLQAACQNTIRTGRVQAVQKFNL